MTDLEIQQALEAAIKDNSQGFVRRQYLCNILEGFKLQARITEEDRLRFQSWISHQLRGFLTMEHLLRRQHVESNALSRFPWLTRDTLSSWDGMAARRDLLGYMSGCIQANGGRLPTVIEMEAAYKICAETNAN